MNSSKCWLNESSLLCIEYLWCAGHCSQSLTHSLIYSSPKSFYYYTILQMIELRCRERKCAVQDHTANRSLVEHSGPQGRHSVVWDLALSQHTITPTLNFGHSDSLSILQLLQLLHHFWNCFLSYGVLQKGESTLNRVPFLEKKPRNKAVILAVSLLLVCNQGHDFRLQLKYLIFFLIPTASSLGYPLNNASLLGSHPSP